MRRPLVLVVPLLAAAACSSSDPVPPSTAEQCETYAPGLTKQAGPLRVKLVEANPSPPAVGTNTFTLEVRDARDQPVDANVTVSPFMPEHGHGSGADPATKPKGPGQFSSELYLPMPGLWRITVGVDASSVGHAETAFRFCL